MSSDHHVTRRSAPKTVNELCDRYQVWADEYYQKPTADGPPGTPGRRPTKEAACMRQAMQALREVAGQMDPAKLTADEMYECQQWMIRAGLCRRLINVRCSRIRRVIKWATTAPQRWLPTVVLTEMTLIDSLRRGRSAAREAEPVLAVDWETVTSTMAVSPLKLATMIELQWWTGMRPGEVARMRRDELSEADGLMIYRPKEHKTQHYGIDRIIGIGPNGQDVLRPWLARLPAGENRVFGLTTNSYRQAVTRINRKHGLRDWTPLQLRHSFATRVEQEADEKTVQKLLSHTQLRTTRGYIDPEIKRALDAMRRFG